MHKKYFGKTLVKPTFAVPKNKVLPKRWSLGEEK